MSIIKSLQDWFKGFDGMELRPLSEIKTDRTDMTSSSYALAASGSDSFKDVTGGRTYINSYVFYAKEAAENEIDRQENNDFIEALVEWVENKEDSSDLPQLPEPYKVESVSVSNGMLLDLYEDGTGLYQVQIQLTFSKRKSV